MNTRRAAGFVAAVAGVVVAAVAVAPGPAAGSSQPDVPDVSMTAGTATVRPDVDGGYVGSMPIRVTYTGPANPHMRFKLFHPPGFYYKYSVSQDLESCTTDIDPWVEECMTTLPFADGQTRDLTVGYRVLARPTTMTRLSLPGSITVNVGNEGDYVDPTPANNTVRFRAVLRGTGGGFDPRPYRPATAPDLSVSPVDGRVVFTPYGDGGYRARFQLTLVQRRDAVHFAIYMILLSEWPGQGYLWTDPMDVCWDDVVGQMCPVSGQLAQDHPRTVTLLLDTRELPPPGTRVVLRAESAMWSSSDRPADAHPADNLVSLPVGVD